MSGKRSASRPSASGPRGAPGSGSGERRGATAGAAGERATIALSAEALEVVAKRFRTLGDATRLALLQAMFEGERTVQELCALTGASQANTSKHLALLLGQGLVARRRDGVFARYRLADDSLRTLCHLVCGSLAARHEAVRASLAS